MFVCFCCLCVVVLSAYVHVSGFVCVVVLVSVFLIVFVLVFVVMLVLRVYTLSDCYMLIIVCICGGALLWCVCVLLQVCVFKSGH